MNAAAAAAIIYFCSEMHFYCCKMSALCICTTFLFRSQRSRNDLSRDFIVTNSANINQVYYPPSFKTIATSFSTPLYFRFKELQLVQDYAFTFIPDAGRRPPSHAFCQSSCSSTFLQRTRLILHGIACTCLYTRFMASDVNQYACILFCAKIDLVSIGGASLAAQDSVQ